MSTLKPSPHQKRYAAHGEKAESSKKRDLPPINPLRNPWTGRIEPVIYDKEQDDD